jgi:hypothetical protein
LSFAFIAAGVAFAAFGARVATFPFIDLAVGTDSFYRTSSVIGRACNRIAVIT